MKLFLCFLASLCLSGCASTQLKESTLGQGETLTDLEYTMVLDNVAMLRQMPGALPWHLKLSQGSVTINNTASPSFNYTGGSSVSRMFGLSAQLGWQEAWTVVPETDIGHLHDLRQTYLGFYRTNWIQSGSGPTDAISGHYGTNYVWVKNDDIEKLTTETIFLLNDAPILPQKGEKGLVLPGPVPNTSL